MVGMRDDHKELYTCGVQTILFFDATELCGFFNFKFKSNFQENKTKKTNLIYFDPHKLHITDHICYLNLGLYLTVLYSHYFNIVTPFSV